MLRLLNLHHLLSVMGIQKQELFDITDSVELLQHGARLQRGVNEVMIYIAQFSQSYGHLFFYHTVSILYGIQQAIKTLVLIGERAGRKGHLEGKAQRSQRAGPSGQDLVVVGSHAVIEVSDRLRVCGQGLPHLGGWAGQGPLLTCRAPLLTLQKVLLHSVGQQDVVWEL